MPSKIAQTAADILARITDKEAGLRREQEEIAELHRQAQWAKGQERRARLEAIAASAEVLADTATGTAAEITEALDAVTAAVRRVCDLGSAYDATLGDLVRQVSDERGPVHPGDNVPPSPADGSVARSRDGLAIGERRIRGLDAATLVQAAVHSGQIDPERAKPNELRLVETVAPLTGPFWSAPESGNVFISDTRPNSTCVEVTRAEFLASKWGVDLRDLPAAILAAITDADRARLIAAGALPYGSAA